MKSLLTTLKRYTTSTILNLGGLSLAFAAFFVLLLQVDYERSYDRFHPSADRIYRLQFTDCATVPRALVETFGRSSSQIVRYSIADLSWDQNFVTEKNGQRTNWVEPMIQVSEDFPKIFDFQMVEGPDNALADPMNVIVPKSMAEKMFPSGGAIGGEILLEGHQEPLRIGAVYRDLPGNSQVKNTIIRRMSDEIGRDTTDVSGYRWRQWNYFMYVELAEGADPKQLLDSYMAQMGDLSGKLQESKELELQLLSDIYFDSRNMTVSYRVDHGDRKTNDILLLVAVLVLAVAGVNFVNFATSLAPIRIKSINTRKIFGASDGVLRFQLIIESLVMCVLAYIISLGWLLLAVNTPIAEWSMSGTVTLTSNPTVAYITAGVALLLGLISGIYPAFYITRVPPILALKGRYGTSRSGRILRTVLVGVQFVVSIVLIIGALMLNEQNRYMRSVNTGINREGVLVVPLSANMRGNMDRVNVFSEKAKSNAVIQDVAFSQFDMGASNNCQGWNLFFGDKDVAVDMYPVSWNFPQVMGLELADGNYYTAPFDSNEWIFMINEAAAKLGDDAKAGQSLKVFNEPARVAAVIKDFHHKSLHYPIVPMALFLQGDTWASWAFVRYVGSPVEAIEHLRKVTKELDSEYIGDIRFLDEAFDAVYKNELRNAKMIMSFSILVVLVALMGVFGLVIFDSRYRRREIGLRRVYGSSTNSILSMFNIQFIKIVSVCFVVAVPFAWWGVDVWLSNFAVRTPIQWWVFLLAGVIVAVITIFTVTVQAWRSAHENPVNSIKSE